MSLFMSLYVSNSVLNYQKKQGLRKQDAEQGVSYERLLGRG